MENKIGLKSISELLGMNFFIPSYQRGYRWTKQQVKDLLDDIQEFIDKKHEGFYCIQPLVVKEHPQATLKLIKEEAKSLEEVKNYLRGNWEVIDGQQRLTTIYIILSYLYKQSIIDYAEIKNKYIIEYETRPNSKEFLEEIDDNKKDENIDYYHMVEAKEEIEEWFKNDKDKQTFRTNLLENVKFIWYESDEEDSIKVFTRLNIGKISLTNAELIKALFLNKSNFQVNGQDYQKIRLQQQEIASEWDAIEYTLQNDEFWLFLNKLDYDKPTRIDFIFDLIREKDVLNLPAEYKKQVGTDEYNTFRYFYFWFKDKKEDSSKIKEDSSKIKEDSSKIKEGSSKIKVCWQKVKTFFQTFQEWFNDLELYHYVGFLIEQGNSISVMIDKWRENQTKEKFITEYIIPQIKNKIKNIKAERIRELQYDKDKIVIYSILLLHNIQTVIDQNQSLKENKKYKMPVFYKFPFHLFKKEKWDVEHIDSHTKNSLEKEKDQKEWLKYSSVGIELSDDLKAGIREYISAKKDEQKIDFTVLYKEIIDAYQVKDGETNRLSDDEKNMLWNLTLLDASTNRGYGNSIFPAKRRVIIGKDKGEIIEVDDNLEEIIPHKKSDNAFIPACTKNVFLKYYNAATNNLREWDKKDVEAYLKNIETTLEKFLK